MDTLVGSQPWKWRAVDWTAAAVSGLAAGAVLMVLDLLWSSFFTPEGPWRTSHMIAPIFIGDANFRASGYAFSTAVVGIALAVHYVLGIVFGLVMATIMAQVRMDVSSGHAAAAGAIMGMALYLINFDLLVGWGFFPWLVELQGWETFAAHVVFGIVAAVLYWRLKRTATEA
jgi:hypothetical protein